MKIQDLVKSTEVTLSHTNPQIVHLLGAIAADTDVDQIRVYPNPKNPNNYLVVKAAEIIGDAVELHDDFVNSQGLTGFKIYRLTLKRGTDVQAVKIGHHKIGESISGQLPKSGQASYPGQCEATWGCSSGCCTYASDGQCYCDHCCIG